MAERTEQAEQRKIARVAAELGNRLAPIRAAGWRALSGREGAVVSVIRKVNDALGRPLAPHEELEDRREFARGYRAEAGAPAIAAAPPPAAKASASEPAPVLVYFLDKQRRDVPRLTEILDSHGVPYKLASLEDDPAALAAVRRDSGGHRLPLVFIAGECVGGREQLLNLGNTGELKKRVFGA